MLKDIMFLSLTKMKRVRPDINTIVISILDSSEASGRPRLKGFRGVLSLEFEDIAEEHHNVEAGAWPDEPCLACHEQFASRGERLPALSDAERIVTYLKHHHASPDPVRVIIHCHAGISRSAAVAEWASVRYWIPLTLMKDQSTDRANPRLLRLLNKAAGIY